MVELVREWSTIEISINILCANEQKRICAAMQKILYEILYVRKGPCLGDLNLGGEEKGELELGVGNRWEIPFSHPSI